MARNRLYTGIDNHAAQFTAANSEYLSVASNATLQTGDIDFTVAGWFYESSTAPAGFNRGLANKTNNVGPDVEWVIYQVAATNQLIFRVDANGDAAGNVVVTFGSVPALATWHFVVAWHDSVGNTINIKVDNGTTATTAHATGLTAGASPFELGKWQASYFDGREACWGFWKRVLTADELTWLYSGGVAPRKYSELGVTGNDGSALKTSLISYWNLDEDSGQRNDSHGTNHLTDNATVTTNPGPWNVRVAG